MHHTTEGGWEQPKIVPFGPLQLHPAAQVLHYGTCCFEGMKAYLGPDGRGLLFRYSTCCGTASSKAECCSLVEVWTHSRLVGIVCCRIDSSSHDLHSPKLLSEGGGLPEAEYAEKD